MHSSYPGLEVFDNLKVWIRYESVLNYPYRYPILLIYNDFILLKLFIDFES